MYSKEDLEKIKNDLTIEQIEELLFSFGADPHIQNNVIISRTICHGGDSHKLFYYDNTKLFKCYTECSETFDVFQLVMKVQKVNNKEIQLPQALRYVLNFFNITDTYNNINYENSLSDWDVLNKYLKNSEEKESHKVEFKIYNDIYLKHLPTPRIIPWEGEGISKEVIKERKICYNPSSQAIVIPHYDKDNNLIGIRERTLIKENEKNGKYKPSILNYQMFNHPLGFNCYNLNFSKENIKKVKKVIVFEGEKSCLLYSSYFGLDNDISVAVCGSNISFYQFQSLLDLGIDELVVAFDKDFETIGDERWKTQVKKYKELNKKFSSLCKISFLFDKNNLLDLKCSPIDCGKDIFLTLFKERVIL